MPAPSGPSIPQAERTSCVRKPSTGFTLIELSIALAVLAVLVTMAAPTLKLQAQRQRETELRAALRDIRGALDAYKQAAKDGRIKLPADTSGYPPTLATLVDGVADSGRSDGQRIYFLRRLPRDPLVDSGDWGLRSYASPPESPSPGADVFDVYSRAPGTGLNGVPYRSW